MEAASSLLPTCFLDDAATAEAYLEVQMLFLEDVIHILRNRKRDARDDEQQETRDARDDEQQERTRPPKRRRYWVRPYLRARQQQGQYHNLMQELSLLEPERYKNFLRLDKDVFDELAERLGPWIEKQPTNFREPLSVGLRLAITLRYLATGDTYTSLGYSFRVAPNSISKLVPETCRAIVRVLGDEVLKMPTTPDGWRALSKGFEYRWNLPHCIGAIDGKHIRIKSPKKSGSRYFNYKGYFSVVLFAVVDSDYKFRYIDVGAQGSESDGGIYAQTRLAQMLQTNSANLPPPEPIQGEPTGQDVDYFLVGDDAFTLRSYLMKPYPGRALTHVERIFNYRLSRARRVVENAFGILAAR